VEIDLEELLSQYSEEEYPEAQDAYKAKFLFPALFPDFTVKPHVHKQKLAEMFCVTGEMLLAKRKNIHLRLRCRRAKKIPFTV